MRQARASGKHALAFRKKHRKKEKEKLRFLDSEFKMWANLSVTMASEGLLGSPKSFYYEASYPHAIFFHLLSISSDEPSVLGAGRLLAR